MLLLLATTGATEPPAPDLTVRRQVTETALQVGKFYPSATLAQTYQLDRTILATTRGLVVGVDASIAAGSCALVIGGVAHRVTFGGQESFAKAASIRPVFSDPLDVPVAAGTVVTTRIFYEAATVQHTAAKALGHNPAFWGSGDGTIDGAGITSHNNTQRFLPTIASLSGMTEEGTVAVLGIGDSIFESGSGNPTGYTLGCRDAGVPFLNAGRWGGQTISTGDVGLTGLTDQFTHVLDQYGFNDITNEAVTKTMADKIATWAWLHTQNSDLKITACTVTPYATSTDSWTTVESQTPNTGTTIEGLTRWQRTTTYNDWLRDGAPILSGVAAPGTSNPSAVRAGEAGHPLEGVLEIADLIEPTRNAGIFRVTSGAISVDGAHMNTLGGDLIAPAVQAWASALT